MILNVDHISKSFGAKLAVDNVSFSVEKGDHVAIVGESGSGKTTLAKMLMGLLKPDTGCVQAEPHSLQMVFQDPYQSLDPLWSIRETLKEGLALRSRQVGLEKKLGQMLAAVGLLPDILDRFPHEFSGGERQRIAIARALLAEPKVLILDEAVSALDTLVQRQVIELLKRLKQEFHLTYIFISHNLRLVRRFSDKIIVMHQGKIVEQGDVSSVLQSPAHPHTRQLVEAAFYKR